MNSRRFYQLFFTTNPNQTNEIRAAFNPLKDTKGFRDILRAMKADLVEQIFFGNNTDKLYGVEHYKGLASEQFNILNNKYQYFDNSIETIALYEKIYYSIYFVTQQGSNPIWPFHHIDDIAYMAMMYFSVDNNPETILNHLDNYYNKHKKSEGSITNYSIYDNFTSIYSISSSVSRLPEWKEMIISDNSRLALILFNNALRIENTLRDQPLSILSALNVVISMPAGLVCDFNDFLYLLEYAADSQYQSQIIDAIPAATLKTWISSTALLQAACLCITSSEVQEKLLDKLGTELLKEMLSDQVFINQRLQVLHAGAFDHLIKLTGREFMTQYIVSSIIYLEAYLRDTLPPSYCKSRFLTEIIPPKQLRNLLHDNFDLLKILDMVNPENRMNFLCNTIGKDKITDLYYMKTMDTFADLLKRLNRFERIDMLKLIYSSEKLKIEMNGEDALANWRALKSVFTSRDDRQVIKEYIFSREELHARNILKNIKSTIVNTTWPSDMHDPLESNRIGKHAINVPKSMAAHVGKIRSAKLFTKPAINVVAEIRQDGREKFQNLPRARKLMHSIFHKASTDKYFANFADDQSFKDAFNQITDLTIKDKYHLTDQQSKIFVSMDMGLRIWLLQACNIAIKKTSLPLDVLLHISTFVTQASSSDMRAVYRALCKGTYHGAVGMLAKSNERQDSYDSKLAKLELRYNGSERRIGKP